MARIKWRKILMHPDKEEIIRRLTDGQSLDKIVNWLNRKYVGKRKNLRVSRKTLQGFRKDFLQLEGAALLKLQEKRLKEIAEQDKKRAKTLLNKSPAYQGALAEVTNRIVDKETRLKQIDQILETQIYNMNDLVDGKDLKAHKVLIEYIKEWRGLVQDWAKLIEGQPDSRVQHDININMVRDEVAVIKNVVISILREIDPVLQELFFDRMDEEFKKLEGKTESKPPEAIEAEFTEVPSEQT